MYQGSTWVLKLARQVLCLLSHLCSLCVCFCCSPHLPLPHTPRKSNFSHLELTFLTSSFLPLGSWVLKHYDTGGISMRALVFRKSHCCSVRGFGDSGYGDHREGSVNGLWNLSGRTYQWVEWFWRKYRVPSVLLPPALANPVSEKPGHGSSVWTTQLVIHTPDHLYHFSPSLAVWGMTGDRATRKGTVPYFKYYGSLSRVNNPEIPVFQHIVIHWPTWAIKSPEGNKCPVELSTESHGVQGVRSLVGERS